MKTFIINMLLPLLVAGVGYLLTAKTSLNGRQRALLATAILCVAFLFCRIVEKRYPDPPLPSSTPAFLNNQTKPKTGDAHSSGSQSPANTGNGNSFEYNNGTTGKSREKPKETK